MAWQLDGRRATLSAKSFVAKFDLEQPYLGLSVGRNQGANQSAIEISPLFAFLVPGEPVECYVRGNDLANRYPPRNSDLVSYQTYYRLTPDGDGIECVLSAQTSLLDSAPLTQVTSSFVNAALLYRPLNSIECKVVRGDLSFDVDRVPEFFLVRPESSDSHSWVLFVHPTDFYRGSVRGGSSPSVALHVFPDSLEKGVIRRATFRIHRLSRTNDEQQAAELFSSAELASPPLTT